MNSVKSSVLFTNSSYGFWGCSIIIHKAAVLNKPDEELHFKDSLHNISLISPQDYKNKPYTTDYDLKTRDPPFQGHAQ
jgi:hypothetical protein